MHSITSCRQFLSLCKSLRCAAALAKRRHAGLVACGCTDNGWYASSIGSVKHLPKMCVQVSCRSITERRVCCNHRLTNHLFHQGAILLRTSLEHPVKDLHNGQAARSAHPGQRPIWQCAGGVDGCRAVSAEKLIVSNIEDKEIGL